MANSTGSGDLISIGPWGDLIHGEPFDFKPNGYITLIAISYDRCVDSISFQCIHKGYRVHQTFGGPDGDIITDQVSINGPDEYITSLNLSIRDFDHQDVISSFGFSTNMTKYGPFGRVSESKLSLPIKDGSIVWFHGRAGKYLNAIGVYVKAKRTIPKLELVESISNITIDDMSWQRECVGHAWGGKGGRPWNDGVYSSVREVRVLEGKFGDSPCVLASVQFLYVKEDGSLVLSPMYGSRLCVIKRNVTINCSKEVLIGIEGIYARLGSGNAEEQITSLTFHTNSRKYGPFGNQSGRSFRSNLYGGKVVGFFGRSGSFLNAIGVHMRAN